MPRLARADLEILRHSLGLDGGCTPSRNRYRAREGAPVLERLVARGLMQHGRVLTGGREREYHVTVAGYVAAGVHPMVDKRLDRARGVWMPGRMAKVDAQGHVVVYGRRGSRLERVAGVLVGTPRRCWLAGCLGVRQAVRWPSYHLAVLEGARPRHAARRLANRLNVVPPFAATAPWSLPEEPACGTSCRRS
jgi:hypothetical protein